MVEGNGLENRRAGNGTVGSNPTPSAKKYIPWRGTQVVEGDGLLNR